MTLHITLHHYCNYCRLLNTTSYHPSYLLLNMTNNKLSMRDDENMTHFTGNTRVYTKLWLLYQGCCLDFEIWWKCCIKQTKFALHFQCRCRHRLAVGCMLFLIEILILNVVSSLTYDILFLRHMTSYMTYFV